nr:MAG TPA_asm: hypothetical protein [Bacteriophage sp.]
MIRILTILVILEILMTWEVLMILAVYNAATNRIIDKLIKK